MRSGIFHLRVNLRNILIFCVFIIQLTRCISALIYHTHFFIDILNMPIVSMIFNIFNIHEMFNFLYVFTTSFAILINELSEQLIKTICDNFLIFCLISLIFIFIFTLQRHLYSRYASLNLHSYKKTSAQFSRAINSFS